MKNLPEIITAYFTYKNGHNKEDLLSVFANDAVVIDKGEGKEVRGYAAIANWIDTSLSGLRLETEIADVREVDDVWIVDTIVSGDFKASPAKFRYQISLTGAEIALLDIAFEGSLRSV